MNSAAPSDAPLLTVLTPAYNEALNLPLLRERIVETADRLGVSWEWVVVDDHSGDETFQVVKAMAAADGRIRGLRLARNSGSHTAIGCGLQYARGGCAAILAADLQDPPETLDVMLEKWRSGAQVVWAVRARREGETAGALAFSRFYYWLMRRVAGLKEMPATGADFLLMDRRVIEAFRQFGESNASMLALVTWMGFRQTSIEYVKQARVHGTSGWSLEKKLKLVIDSLTSFSYLPVRLMSLLGAVIAVLGFLYAGFVLWNALAGQPVQGWSSLMVAVLVVGGFQMLIMGVLGEYIWRALDEARRRPRFLIEDSTEER